MNKNIIHIALTFDKNYITPFFVVLTSVFSNNQESRFHVHAIATGVSTAEKDRISAFVQQHQSKISFYEITADQLQGLLVPENSHLSVAMYYRLFLPFLLPEQIGKLLYLDTDIVVIGNLSDLYNTNLDNLPFGAIPEISATKNRPDLGIYEEGVYFNSGVILMNIPEWKKQKITEKAIQYIHDYPEKLVYPDQDALNVVAENHYYKLDGKYNVLPFDIPEYLPRSKYDTFLKDKVIMHYTLKEFKPWSILSTHHFSYLYKIYFKQSPQANEKMYTDVEMTPLFMLRMAKSQIKPIRRKFPEIDKSLLRIKDLFKK
ncbi:MAG: hypothetical protein COW65_00880 [Cytophagales bacterium CG18_big_fil_WC_8_21_14_2_50_42_9]|nr:MAG: hypothetical protein COW65_00880 [Cytophagales bacterium CG18_big_fil_WC_8_21_14_2_50_42_9]